MVRLFASSVLYCFALFAFADFNGKVVSVTDGDTIKVRIPGEQVKVRLKGIDAPEKGQPYGNKSRKHLASLVAGKKVRVEFYRRDRYGRVLGKVWVGDTDANLEQIRQGYAWWYEYYKADQSKADRKAYKKAHKKAKKAKLGLWADRKPINPYDWRKGKR